MSLTREDAPVYYREIQKNAYLKRIPNEVTGSKLRPLGGSKKAPLKAMWTQFCVHNGRTPYLEQYPDAESTATHSHKPIWRACLLTARHVTASVKPHSGDQYDFLVDTDIGAVRMLAPDWESMQDWVSTLRNTLHELKILSKGENVYCVAPAPSPAVTPRAAARDPTSPLPPTPPVPPDRVPGIELVPTAITRPPEPLPTSSETTPTEPQTQETSQETIDISNWNSTLPSTSQRSESTESSVIPSNSESMNIESVTSGSRKGVAKICGQNICLDDSLFKRSNTDSDEEFFAEIDRLSDEETENDYTQRVVVSNVEKETNGETSNQNHQASNITVIQVSNKEPPHTAIPVMGPETDVFDFEFKQKVTVNEQPRNPNFVNIVNTEQNEYGTTFGSDKNESEYGHLSLTTTVNLTGSNDSIFKNQSTSILNNQTTSILNNQSTSNQNNELTSILNNQSSTSIITNPQTSITDQSTSNTNNHTTLNNEEVYERLCMASTSNSKPSPLPVRKLKKVDKRRKSSLPNLEVGELVDSTYEYLFLSNNNANSVNVTAEVNCNGEARVPVQAESNGDPVRVTSVERSRSQNAYDSTSITRPNAQRRVQNNSPKREVKNVSENPEPQSQKPIWKRGLTELSLLTRLKSIGLTKKHESPTRVDNRDRGPAGTSPVKVVHRSRPENRIDGTRRRSSSLSNGQSPIISAAPNLITLRARQAATLRAEQRRGAALVASISVRDSPVFADYDNQVWVAWWGAGGSRSDGRPGDRVAALGGRVPPTAHHAHTTLARARHHVDIHFHRVPLGKIYVINKRDQESIGIKLDAECNIVRVEPHSGAARAGLPPTGHWALTEINNRPINLIKGGEDDMNRLSKHGTEVSVLIQPSPLVKKLRSALKGNSSLLGLR